MYQRKRPKAAKNASSNPNPEPIRPSRNEGKKKKSSAKALARIKKSYHPNKYHRPINTCRKAERRKRFRICKQKKVEPHRIERQEKGKRRGLESM